MAVWRELIFGKRETSKLHLSLMIYQIQYLKSETRGSGHLFICWSSKTASLSFLCPLTEIKALSFVGWDTLGDRRHHRGSCREPCLSARPLASSSHCMWNADQDEWCPNNCLVSIGHETRNSQNALCKEFQGSRILCFLSFLPPVLVLRWSKFYVVCSFSYL